MTALALVALIATNGVWLTLLVVGRIRWQTECAKPKCSDCPLTRSVQVPIRRVELPLHEQPVLSLR